MIEREKECVICGAAFAVQNPRWNTKTCSPECQAVLRERTKRIAVKRYQPRQTVRNRIWRHENRPARLEQERRYRTKKRTP